jgi:hypothetical protein
MKRYDSDDELERALFALDLEEPPAGLRDSILAGTIYHVPVAAVVRPWEVWIYGGLCAALVWLLIAVVRGAASGAATDFATTFATYGDTFWAFISQPATIFWLGVGAAATVFSQVNLTALPGVRRAARR